MIQQFEGGAGSRQTHDANVRAFESVMFRPRHGVFVLGRDQSTTVLRHWLRTPLYAAPIGVPGVGYADGELGVALMAAGEDGVRRILESFQRDIDRTLAYLGCSSLEELTPEHLAISDATCWAADDV
jgi:isopentenyl diphosphate isomerase/L-lactate dehydrogenase-like FMN-dependent dehydrogenase